MSGTATPRRARRRTRLGTRLLLTLLVPLAALVVLGGVDARERLARADAAEGIQEQAASAERQLARYLDLVNEQTASQTIVMAANFGLAPEDLDELLGIELSTRLAGARAAVDAGGVPAPLRPVRAAIDAGTAEPAEIQPVFAGLARAARDQWLVTVEDVGDSALDADGSAPLRRTATAMVDAAEGYAHASAQTGAAGRVAIPGLSGRPSDVRDLAAVTAVYEQSVADLAARLPERARAVWQDRVVDDPGGRAFEAFVHATLDAVGDGAASTAAATPGGFDLARLAAIFRAGLDRQAAHQAVVEAAAAETVSLAADLRAAALADVRAGVLTTSVLVLASLAVTALTARSTVRPLRRLAERAGEVSSGRIEGPALEPAGPHEVAVVTEAFNESVATLLAVADEAAALADADFDHPSLREPVPGRIGESLRRSVDRLSRSMQENEELRRDLARKATHDALTGLPNRVLLLDRLQHAIARTERSEETLAVVFVDLDHFKGVNDTLGHAAGDELLVEVARRIQSAVRSSDSVARFGGDEFVVVLDGVRPGQAADVCEAIGDLLQQPFVLGGSEVRVSASQGVVVARPGDTAEDLLRTADAAMYAAKARGRARSVVADDTTRARAARHVRPDGAVRDDPARATLVENRR